MNGLTDFQIMGYRGIGSLHLTQLQRVNVLLGNNNCGKSSILEAILIMLGAAYPHFILDANAERNYNKCEKEDLAFFFHNLELNSTVNFKASFRNGSAREVSVSYYEKTNIKDVPLTELQDKKLDSAILSRYGLQINYTDGDENKSSWFEIKKYKDKEPTISIHKAETDPVRFGAIYLAPRYSFDDSIKSFNKIITDKEKGNVIDILRLIEPRINDVAVVNNTVMVDVGLEKMIPINLLGDGIRKIFAIIIALYSVRGGVLLIDEIDNGLYYKSVLTLWKALIQISAELDVQLFVSSHCIDTLNALKSVLTTDLPEYRDDTKIYTLRKMANDEVKSYSYTYEMFSHVLNMGVEIR